MNRYDMALGRVSTTQCINTPEWMTNAIHIYRSRVIVEHEILNNELQLRDYRRHLIHQLVDQAISEESTIDTSRITIQYIDYTDLKRERVIMQAEYHE